MNDKINILLIEDNPADSELVNIFLRSAYSSKYSLVRADSLVKGFQKLKDSMIDVIILDLSLPDSRGLDTLNKLYAEASDTPIIVLTGIEDETIGIDAVKMGAQDFLIKGKVKGRELQRSINYSIERYKLMRALSAKANELEEKTNALNKEKQKLALAHKIARIASWEWDLLTGKATWSDELFELHGIEVAHHPFTFRELLAHIHPDDREGVWEVITNAMNSLKPLNFYYRVIRNDGDIRTFYSIGEVVVNEEGNPVKVIGIRQDVTERMAEEEMQKLALAATKTFNSVIITDKHGSIEWVNEGFTKLTGYSLDEVKNTHGEILRRGEKTGISEDAEFYKVVMGTKEPISYESKNYSKGGRNYWTITTLTPVLDNKGQVGKIIAIDTDITARKSMEEDLKRANKDLEETMQVKEQFLANMSHEIRTPMNAIIGFTRQLLQTNPSAEQKQYIDIIKTSGSNLLVIVNDILDFSKLHSGKIAFEQIEFSLGETIASLTELLQPKALEKNLNLITSIDEKIHDTLLGDPTRLSQILINLVSNAIKFTMKGEVKISVDLLNEEEQKMKLKFSVADTGIGIAKDKIPTMFDEFTQASTATNRKFGGTGLGLAIVKQLVEQQGGKISVKSDLNAGSEFSFMLSFKKGTGKNVKRKETHTDLSQALPAGRLKILLVEDNELNAVLAVKVLNDRNWNVEVAEDGFKAIEKIKQNDFDIVLMDVQLPGMDGYEATRKIRTEQPSPKNEIPIIAMTAHALAGDDDKCYEAGMNGYISKPFEPEMLYRKILSALHINSKGKGGEKELNPEASVETANAPGIIKTARHSDLTYLKGLANGSNTFIAQMLNIFIEQTPLSIERMEKAMKSGEWKTFRFVVHKMKPSIMFTGLSEIANDIPLLEDYAAEESHLDAIPPMVDKIKKVCTEAILELKEDLKLLGDIQK